MSMMGRTLSSPPGSIGGVTVLYGMDRVSCMAWTGFV